MPRDHTISRSAARRFAIEALGLSHPFPDSAAALEHLGYVQIDPLNICGRMHDLILRNRVSDYREGDLMRHLHGGSPAHEATDSPSRDVGAAAPRAPLPSSQRTAFEHHHPDTNILVAFPLEAWPHLRAAMRRRAKRTSAWSGRLTPTERKLVPDVLAEITARGPLGSEDFKDARRARRSVWGAATVIKSILQKLFFHGELLIAARERQRRRYDLPERVLPQATLRLPEPSASETARFTALLKIRQRRLSTLRREELKYVEDAVCRIQVPECPPLYCLAGDIGLLDKAASAAGPDGPGAHSPIPLLLAPLDPLIYDRRVTAALWDFDYTWEAYTPAAKRVRGHYALPVLSGTELVGHVEPQADRAAGRLRVASRSVRRGFRTAEALDRLAEWLELRR